MGGLSKYTFYMVICALIIGSSYFQFVESRGVHSTLLSSTPTSILSTGAPASKTRSKRSCGNHVGLIFLEACNKNHKRSPFIITVILMEYYFVPEQEGNEKIDQRNATEREIKHEPEFANPTVSTLVIASAEHEDDDKRKIHPHGDMDRSLNRFPLSYSSRQRERLKRAPVAGVNFQTLLEKCCSLNGCGTVDFTSLC